MPYPRPNEAKKDWMTRCMADSEQVRSTPDEKKRYAVCESKWERRNNATPTQPTARCT